VLYSTQDVGRATTQQPPGYRFLLCSRL